MHMLLVYEYVPDIVERRGPYRDQHLRLAWAAHDRGELLLAGALSDPVDGALFLFAGPQARDAAERFAAADPYRAAGLVRRWGVRPWHTVVGDNAASPLRP